MPSSNQSQPKDRDMAAAARALLRDLGAPLLYVSGSSGAFDEITVDDPRLHAAFESARELSGLAVDDATDLAIVVLAALEGRLARAGVQRPAKAAAAAYAIALGALADGMLYEIAGLDLTPCLARQLDLSRAALGSVGVSGAVLSRIAGALEAKDTRTVLHELAPIGFGLTAGEAANLMGVALPQRPPQIDPAWSARHQEKDRPIQFWFDGAAGSRQLFIVYYTSKCAFGLCHGCALPELSSLTAVTSPKIMAQTDLVLDQLMTHDERESVRTLVLSNNGSVLDEGTFPQAALLHALVRAADSMPRLEVVSLETRAEIVRDRHLKAIRDTLASVRGSIKYELAVGVEIFDETLRNRVARKGLSNRAVERLAQLVSQHDGGLRCYFMLKPLPTPLMTEDSAFEDLEKGLDYFDDLAERHDVPITVHVNPTYAAVGTELETEFREGRFTPPDLSRLEALLTRRRLGRARVFIGLNDEGLAVEGGSFLRREVRDSVRRLQRFNSLQDPKTLLGS